METSDERVLVELSEEECLELVSHQSVGRVAVATADDEAPLVVPVNYALDGRAIVFRTGSGTKVSEVRRRRVSFEVDEVDPFHRTGWSVLVRGAAHEATEWETAHVGVDPWVPEGKHRWVRIEPTSITGRRIVLPAFTADQRGYL